MALAKGLRTPRYLVVNAPAARYVTTNPHFSAIVCAPKEVPWGCGLVRPTKSGHTKTKE